MVKMQPFCVANPKLSSFALFSLLCLLQIFFIIIKHVLYSLGRSIIICIPNIFYLVVYKLFIALFLLSTQERLHVQNF